jgi:SAM-dependent methyltransferase
MWVLSMELFGVALALPDFPRVRSIRGLGTSDPDQYALPLAEKFDYRNTHFTRQPFLDLTNPPEQEYGTHDFLVSSEVFEHVLPPASNVFANVYRLLKSCGVLVFTVPYSLEASMREHYPGLREFGFAQIGERVVLVNRTSDGAIQVFEDPVFHFSAEGPALEVREFNETALRTLLADAGFAEIRIYSEDCRLFGILHSESWALPIAARKGPRSLSSEATREVLGEWRDLKVKFNTEMQHLLRSRWFRAGRKLGLV